ncbi:MAG: cobalamin-binding protein [Candidatus Omnitrophica bacterium]|nr:cobalamin-binding protein [Candidatus Omnitrophota bacterium]
MRICSFLPSATEILFALGLDEQIVGVSHECDFPPQARAKPRVVTTRMDSQRLSSEEIDRAVRTALRERTSLYRVDVEALRRARPDLLVTQQLCDVCAIDTATVSEALEALSYRPEVVSLHPHTLSETLDDIRVVGERTGHLPQAEVLLQSLRGRIDRVHARVAHLSRRPRVFCLEWLKPPMACGHWVPEQVELAGGHEVLGRTGEPSRYVTWEEIAAAEPDLLVLMPCGLSVERTRRELSLVTDEPLWRTLPAVRQGRVHLVNGPAYFNRSGPRSVDGVELLMRLISTVFVITAVALGTLTAAVWADTVRLKSGRTISGHVVKQDDAQVIIATSSGSDVVAASDVKSISYSDLRFTPRRPSEQALAPPTEAATMDTALLDRIRTRLLAGHRYLQQTQKVLNLLVQGKPVDAGSEAQRAARHLLPTTARGVLSPLSALADLVILLGFHSTLLWLFLVLVRERRSIMRTMEFLLLSYCLIMLLMLGIGAAFGQGLSAGLWVEAIGVPLLLMALAVLFCWMFTVRPLKALTVGLLATGASLGLGVLLR